MKFYRDNKYIRWGLTIFCVIAASLLFYFAIFHMDSLKSGIGKIYDIILPILYGAVMAYLLSPIVNFLEKQVIFRLLKRCKIKVSDRLQKVIRLTCVLLTIFLVLLCVYGLLAMLIPEIINSITSIIDNFPRYLDNIQKWMTKVLKDNPDLVTSVNDIFTKYSAKAESWLTNDMLPQLNGIIKDFSLGLMGVVTFLKNLVLGIIISIYILYSKESLIGNAKKGLYAILHMDTANQVIKDTQFINNAFGGFILGRILDSAIIGVLCYIGTSFLDMPYALLISVIVGVTNVIPYFGPFMGAIPSALLIFMVSPIQAVYFIIFILVLQQFDGNILGPMILRGVTGLTSFLVIVSIILGGGLFGVFGMLVGVPACVIICTIIRNLMNSRLMQKGMSVEREFYTGIDHVDSQTCRPVKPSERPEINAKDVFRYRNREHTGDAAPSDSGQKPTPEEGQANGEGKVSQGKKTERE